MSKEYIERGALLKDISESVVFTVRDGQHSLEIRGANKITDRIKSAPAADVVEVVRCKECQFAEANGGDCNSTLPITYRNYVCEINETKYITLEYCSHGKRKEGAE